MQITLNESMGVFRPGWTSNNLAAFENARYCGDKDGYFKKTHGMPGKLLRREAQKRTAGGFSSETHWWQGPCICDACGHAWQGVVEIPIESTYPQVPLECSECHQMTGGPA